MLILDIELTDESPTLEQFLPDWWARLWARLRRRPLLPAGVATETEERDRYCWEIDEERASPNASGPFGIGDASLLEFSNNTEIVSPGSSLQGCAFEEKGRWLEE
jgi:hypothetical protein